MVFNDQRVLNMGILGDIGMQLRYSSSADRRLRTIMTNAC